MDFSSLQDGKFVAGAGATEIELARRVQQYGEVRASVSSQQSEPARMFSFLPGVERMARYAHELILRPYD